ncbi:hypothetical protein FG379_003721 [Cryptosporidium bovis]|uniref:uncharacterized protein n=1 Tax=Cryptosporidium bovis TaxID=310047 RepID=UPI00351A941A|nr:hypothetical protein FG379_003721 [Cryptosporidium bovis]
MRYNGCCAPLLVLISVVLFKALNFDSVICTENADLRKITKKESGVSADVCQWRLFYQFSLMSTSRVKLLPLEKPKSFIGGENKKDLFKSCFRGIRELLKKQWNSYEGMRHYRNSDLKENLIRIGKEKLISAPKTKEQGKSIFEDVKYFCIYVTSRYFELVKESNNTVELLNVLCSKPTRKMTRLMLPIDVRFRGENILSELEEKDQRRIEEEEKSREDLEKQKRGELVPKEGVIPIHETLERHSKSNPLLEISQYIENKSFYENWMDRDKIFANKVKNFPNSKEIMLHRAMFGVTEGGKSRNYKSNDAYISQSNSGAKSDFNFTLPENWEEIQNKTLDIMHHSKSENRVFDHKYKIPQQKATIDRNNDYIKNNEPHSKDQYDILKSEEKELGIGLLKDEKKVESLTRPSIPRGSTLYYKGSRDPYIMNSEGRGVNIPFSSKDDDLRKNYEKHFYKLGPGGELNVRNPDLLVPLDEVYDIPSIFRRSHSDLNTTESLEIPQRMPRGPLGFDQFGLLNIPSRERTKKEIEYRIYSTKNKFIDDGNKLMKPLNVEYPSNSRVLYVNLPGLREYISGYDLNPELGRLEMEVKEYNENNELNKILRDFLKSIEAKKRNRFGYIKSGQIKRKIDRRANSFYDNRIPKSSDLKVSTIGFAPLKNTDTGSNFVTRKIMVNFEEQDEDESGISGEYEHQLSELKPKFEKGTISGKTTSHVSGVSDFGSTGFKKCVDEDNVAENDHEESEDQSNATEGRRTVRFQVPENEKKQTKRYVSPPPEPVSEESENDD